MVLESPSNIRRSDQHLSYTPILWNMDEFVKSPVLEYKTQDKHQGTQSVVYGGRRDCMVSDAVADPF
jgi:hypothetical protein